MANVSRRTMEAYLHGFLAGHQVAKNKALHALDGRRGTGPDELTYYPERSPGCAYETALAALSDASRDKSAENAALRYAERSGDAVLTK